MADKKKKHQPEPEPAPQPTPQEEAQQPAAEPETYTVTREQMEKMELLAKELAEGQEKYLRLAAEYDNFRKRSTREKESIYSDARIDTIQQFLGVYDNLERGLAQYEEGSVHRQGIEMILKQFVQTLGKLGVSEMEALGKPFDPNCHNAVMHVEEEGVEESTVVEVFQKGFVLGERVLRFAIVKVAN